MLTEPYVLQVSIAKSEGILAPDSQLSIAVWFGFVNVSLFEDLVTLMLAEAETALPTKRITKGKSNLNFDIVMVDLSQNLCLFRNLNLLKQKFEPK